jgi:plastocyanin
MNRRGRQWLIGVTLTIVVLTGVYFGVSAIIGYQETAKQNAQLQASPVIGVMQVNLSNFSFDPANIAVHVGTTVTWTNHDNAPHTVTFSGGLQGSAIFNQGQTFSYTFTSIGTFAYHCAVHPGMVGRVTVIP